MSQDPETFTDLPGTDPVATPEPEQPKEQPRQNQLPQSVIEEMQELRRSNRMREEELHSLRVATLRASAPQVDPVEAAYQRLQEAADPDAFKYIGPVVKPLLEEMHAMRQLNSELSQNVQFLAQRDREREVHTQLANLIPDLPTLGPRLLELVANLPAQQQKLYADNPHLFVPLAESIRQQGGKRGNAAARASTILDTGGADRVIPTTADAISAMDPSGKDFAALQRSFYGADV